MGEVFDEVGFASEDGTVAFRGALIGVRRGDPGWLEVHGELLALHVEKSADYGSPEDAMSNYVLTSEAVGEPDEFACWLRMHEKVVRALNLIRAGRADENKEGADVAALAIGAEALRRRRAV